jgi:hypothetical protein
MSEEPLECHANPGGFARAMAYIEEVQVRRFVPFLVLVVGRRVEDIWSYYYIFSTPLLDANLHAKCKFDGAC